MIYPAIALGGNVVKLRKAQGERAVHAEVLARVEDAFRDYPITHVPGNAFWKLHSELERLLVPLGLKPQWKSHMTLSFNVDPGSSEERLSVLVLSKMPNHGPIKIGGRDA